MVFYGYVGNILKIDLNTKDFCIEKTDLAVVEKWLGGRGLGVQLLKPFARLEPFAPEMPLIFATGPLTGTSAPTSGRMSVVSKSPLTNTVFDCSVGGRFGSTMKRAGFDVIVLTGKSPKWLNIYIDNHQILFEDASNSLDLTPIEIAKTKGLYQSVAAIGVAGINLVSYASIIFDGHYAAGRGGLGAVMGAKNVKAIYMKGNNPIKIAHPQELIKHRDDVMRLLNASPSIFGEFGISEYGTPALVDLIHSRRMEPTANFKKTFFEKSSVYSAYAIKTNYKTKKTGCFGCPILCKKTDISGMPLPEYETISHFGALNECADLNAIISANRLCNDFAVDTISTASTISCYSEINGRVLNGEDIKNLIHDIAFNKTALGGQLARGSLKYAQDMGAAHLSMSVKGLELPAYDPRGAYGLALSYAVSNRGGCHLRAYPISHEILRKPVATDRFTFEGKARIIKIAEDLNAVIDSLTACKFVFFAAGLEEYCKILNAIVGCNHDVQSLLKIGANIWQCERDINISNGFTEADDDLPMRFFTEEGSSSRNIKILPINREDFLRARSNYYQIRGWYTKNTQN